MRLNASHLYSADPVTVHAMLVDPDFQQHAAIQMGATSATASGDGIVAVMPAPSEIVAFVGPTLTLEQRMLWQVAGPDGARQGRLEVVIVGAPVQVSGSTLLAPELGRTRFDYVGDLRVDIPILGRSLERKAAPFITEVFELQYRIGQAWLTR